MKREEKKVWQRRDRTTGRSHQKNNDSRFTICTTGADVLIDSAVLLLFLYTLIDRCLVQSAVSNLFPNQWRCLTLYLPLPVCLICRCVFWLVILFSNLSLCFLTCYFVFEFVVVFSDLLFCFRICRCVFWIVILFFRFAFAFVICYFVFRIVICFALLSHHSFTTKNLNAFKRTINLSVTYMKILKYSSCCKYYFVIIYHITYVTTKM